MGADDLVGEGVISDSRRSLAVGELYCTDVRECAVCNLKQLDDALGLQCGAVLLVPTESNVADDGLATSK